MLQNLAREALQQLDYFKPKEIANTLWGLALLEHDPKDDFWLQTQKRLLSNLTPRDFWEEGLCMLFQVG